MEHSSENPLYHDVVLRKLFSFLDVQSLKKARVVCKTFNIECWSRFQTKTTIKLGQKSTTYKNCVPVEDFSSYLHSFVDGKLEFDPKDFLFRNFIFINHRSIHGYPHQNLLQNLLQNVPESVQSLAFVDNPSEIHEPHAFPLMKDGIEAQLHYPEWKTFLHAFPNLQELGLHFMRTTQIEIILQCLINTVESGNSSLRIKKLAICPGNFIEFDMSRSSHQSYIDLLKTVTARLTTIEDFTLYSNLSAEEISIVLKNMQNRLTTLRLRRFPLLPAQIQLFQNTESSIFPDVKFPRVKHLEIPNVYFHSFEQVNQNVPSLESLKLKYQPMLVCTEPEQNYIRDVEEDEEDNDRDSSSDSDSDHEHNIMDHADLLSTECVAVRLNFCSCVEPQHRVNNTTNINVKSLEWTVDVAHSNFLRNFDITIPEINDVTLHSLSIVYPQITKFKVYITNSEDIISIWEKYVHVEELIFSHDSPHGTTDQDIIGSITNHSRPDELTGIRCLTKLRRLVLRNNNSNLTEESFTHGFFRLPSLRSLEIYHAPQLLNSQILKNVSTFHPYLLVNVVH